MNDMITAARHHRELDGTLLTTRVHKDAEALIRAHRLMCGETRTADLIRTAEWKSTDDDESDNFMTPVQEFYDDDVKTMRTSMDWLEVEKRRQSSDDNGLDSAEEYEGYEDSVVQRTRARDERMDVSELDVATIVPRVMSHRLRVRDGPVHEIFSSAMYPAAMPGLQAGQKKTIQEVLTAIFKD